MNGVITGILHSKLESQMGISLSTQQHSITGETVRGGRVERLRRLCLQALATDMGMQRES